MTANVIRRGRALLAVVVICAAVIVGAFWLRSQTIDATTARICDKVDALTAALVRASTEAGGTPPNRARLEAFVESAACDPDNIERIYGR
jgi:hypothetical protein